MKLERKFPGKRYDVTVISDSTDGYFEIYAEHKKSKRYSSVTNLNYLLGQIIGDDVEEKDVGKNFETTICIGDPIKHKQVTQRAIKLFQDKYWIIKYVEPAFDEDRGYGEWNSPYED